LSCHTSWNAYGGKRGVAIERDGFACQHCGKKYKEARLEIHHIDGRGSQLKVSEQNNSLDNLITLCVPCHNKVDNHKRAHKPINRILPCIDCNELFYRINESPRCLECWGHILAIRKLKILHKII